MFSKCPECSSTEVTASYITQASGTIGNHNILYINQIDPADATLDLITCFACGYEYSNSDFYQIVTKGELP